MSGISTMIATQPTFVFFLL